MNEAQKREAIQEFVQLCADSFKLDGAIRLSEPEITILLLGTAVTMSLKQAIREDDAMDVICQYAWWDISNALTRKTRVVLHTTMRSMGVPFPPHPGDLIVHAS